MIRLPCMMALAVLALAPSAHAAAPPVNGRAITSDMLDHGEVKLDPAKAYILVSGPNRVIMEFLRQPDDETIKAWQADFDKALTKAKNAYPAKLAAW